MMVHNNAADVKTRFAHADNKITNLIKPFIESSVSCFENTIPISSLAKSITFFANTEDVSFSEIQGFETNFLGKSDDFSCKNRVFNVKKDDQDRRVTINLKVTEYTHDKHSVQNFFPVFFFNLDKSSDQSSESVKSSNPNQSHNQFHKLAYHNFSCLGQGARSSIQFSSLIHSINLSNLESTLRCSVNKKIIANNNNLVSTFNNSKEYALGSSNYKESCMPSNISSHEPLSSKLKDSIPPDAIL